MEHIVYLAAAPVTSSSASKTAHSLLNRLYEKIEGTPAPALRKEPGGKPYFTSGPWHCSITHTKTMAFCALSPCPIGIDAEAVSRSVRENTARRVLSQKEYSVYEAQPQCFPAFWTLKEAYVKFTGEGLRKDLQSLSFSLTHRGAVLENSGLIFCRFVTKQHVVSTCTSLPVKLQFVSINSQ